MSQTSTTFFVGIGPSGSEQATVPLTTPTSTFPITTSTTTTTTSTTSTTMSSTSSSPSATATSGGNHPASHSLPIGAIVGGTLGGLVAILWFLGLMYYAHQHNCFRRPGYQRAMEERGAFEKRERPRSGIADAGGPFGDRPSGPPGPQTGIGARTFGEPPRSTFNEPPKRMVGDPPPPPRPVFADLSEQTPQPNVNNPPNNRLSDPPRTTFSDPPRTTFSDPPRSTFDNPSRTTFSQLRPNYENRPISGFSDRDRERPRSSFGERPRSAFGDRRSVEQERTRRGFFGGTLLHSDGTGGEWEGAGARRETGYGTPEMEEKLGWWAWLTRAKHNAAQKKRVKAEYEEDMRKMRGRSAIESDYGRY
ncbi:hypothetical protein FRC08_002382 [Ceratobasidium sp. 394]|nr:hypothetical protein FRC08_002382 [Ceratobasidium sp. 394]